MPLPCLNCLNVNWKYTRAIWSKPRLNWRKTGVPIVLRRLEALLAVANESDLLIITGNGDVIQPENDLIAIGSGGPYAQSAAHALLENTELGARDIVKKALGIAGDICIYTNQFHTIEELTSKAKDPENV